ncbi:hypothetical protein, partial [Joostella sp. CR20]|uniref:hypothetical protein n=1 Tax=Joostella sp. CR20 TaxID=2804312 RepID=UPI00313E5631
HRLKEGINIETINFKFFKPQTTSALGIGVTSFVSYEQRYNVKPDPIGERPYIHKKSHTTDCYVTLYSFDTLESMLLFVN